MVTRCPPSHASGVQRRVCVRLLKVHRILITSGLVMCLVYTLRQVLRYANTHNGIDLVTALCGLLVAVALGLYLRSLRAYYK